jgi:toxin ParE1/3/4
MIVIKRARVWLDLDEIAEYIGRSNPPAALRFLDAFDQTVASLAPMPEMGSLWESDHPRLYGLRTWPVRGCKKYLIFYRPIDNGVEILRVLHGARDLDAILE